MNGLVKIPNIPINFRNKIRLLQKKIGQKKFYTKLLKIDPKIKEYKSFHELPVPAIGCDSSATWAKEYMHLTTYEKPSLVAERLIEITPNKKWENIHLVITGGEPLMWQKQLPELLSNEKLKNLKHITFETNGTQIKTTIYRIS